MTPPRVLIETDPPGRFRIALDDQPHGRVWSPWTPLGATARVETGAATVSLTLEP